MLRKKHFFNFIDLLTILLIVISRALASDRSAINKELCSHVCLTGCLMIFSPLGCNIIGIHFFHEYLFTWAVKKTLRPHMYITLETSSAGGIIRPYIFENEAGAAVSVNGLRYRTMINEFLWPELEDMDVDDVCF